jgi:hypothetical protein
MVKNLNRQASGFTFGSWLLGCSTRSRFSLLRFLRLFAATVASPYFRISGFQLFSFCFWVSAFYFLPFRVPPCSSVDKILVRVFGVFRGFPAACFSAPFLSISAFQLFSFCFCVSAFAFSPEVSA